MQRIFEYYKKLLQNPEYSISRLRESSILWLHLTEGVSYDYLERESWDRLVIGLYVRGRKVCSKCFVIRPWSTFAGLDGMLCADCVETAKAQRRQRWRDANRDRLAKYMKSYRRRDRAGRAPDFSNPQSV